jgi:hypothetical protein
MIFKVTLQQLGLTRLKLLSPEDCGTQSNIGGLVNHQQKLKVREKRKQIKYSTAQNKRDDPKY